MSIESVIPCNHLILCHRLLLLPSIFPSIRVFFNESTLLIRWPKCWSFSISPSNEYSGWFPLGLNFFKIYFNCRLIILQYFGGFCHTFTWVSHRCDCFDLLLSKRLSKIFSNTTVWKHQFFSIRPSLWANSHICTRLLERIIALTIWSFVGKVMSLLFNVLSRFAITFFPRSKCLLILWLQSLSAVILETKKIKSVTISTSPPSICHEMVGLDAMILVFWVLSQLFNSPLSPSLKGSLVLHFLLLGWYHQHIRSCWYFSQQSWFQLMIHPAWLFMWYTLHLS